MRCLYKPVTSPLSFLSRAILVAASALAIIFAAPALAQSLQSAASTLWQESIGQSSTGTGSPPPGAPGFYLVGSKNLDPAEFHHAGDMQFWSWSGLEPEDDVYTWSALDSYLNSHSSNGKRVGIAITTYDARGGAGALQMPAWLRERPGATIPGVLTEEVDNGDFEAGSLSSWSASGLVAATDTSPHGGAYAAALGGAVSDTAELSQSGLRIPYVLSQGQLSYWWRMETTETGGAANDVLTVELLDGSNQVVLVQEVSNLTGNTAWQQQTLDLVPYDGHWATLRFRVTNDGANPTTVYVDDVSLTVQPVLPKIWDQAYLDPYRDFVQALGQRYGNDPGSRVEFIALGTGTYGETRASDLVDRPATEAYGLDSQLWVDTVNAITDEYLDAFSEGGELRTILLLQQAPYQFERWERREFSAYAAERGVGLSFNSLYWDWNFAEAEEHPDPLQEDTAAYDPHNRYWPQVPVAFEGYAYMLGNQETSERFYWSILNALDKRASYLRLSQYAGWYLDENDDPVPAYTDIMAWAAPYFGRTAANTPSAWVALRDHVTPTFYHYARLLETSSYYPPLGNFDFWLYQRDEAVGGRTVAETYLDDVEGHPPQLGLCPEGAAGPEGYPCHALAHNPELPHAREARMIRRTDQLTGNPWMFFDVDEGYIFGSGGQVEVQITYWDHGRDSFRLQYESTAGPAYARLSGSTDTAVHKQDSDQFLTATFLLDDVRLANGLSGHASSGISTDLALDSRDELGVSDGDEWVHFVDVRRLYVPPASPTQLVAAASISGEGTGDVLVSWDQVTSDVKGNPATIESYHVYRATGDPYFKPAVINIDGATSTTSYEDPGALGDPEVNHFYLVTAIDGNGHESSPSQRVGEFEFALTPGQG